MKRLLLAAALVLSSLSSQAQALLGRSSKVVTAYLRADQADHRTVYDRHGNVAFIVRNMDGGDAVYYFEGDTCTSYSVIRYGVSKRDVAWSLDQQYKRDGNVWCMGAENAYITVAEAVGSVFINILGTHY